VVAVGAVLVSTGVEILPTEGLVSILTPARLLILAGLAALVAAGARLPDFRTGLDPAIGVLLLAALATTYLGSHPSAPLRFLLTALALFYLTVGLCRRLPEQRGSLILLALVAVVPGALLAVAQVAQDEPTTFYRDGFTPVLSLRPRDDLLVRAVGSFANPNLLAAHVLLLAPVAVLVALRAPWREARAVATGVLALTYLGLVLTFSRAGIGAAVVAAGVVGFALRPAWRARLRGAALAGGMILLLGALVTGGGFVGGFGRPEAMSLGLQVWSANPLLGVGLSRAGEVMEATGAADTPYSHAHNLWLTWLVDAGPLAFLAMVWIAGWLLSRGYRAAESGGGLTAAALAGLVGLFALSVVDHPANSERIAIAFWFVAALVASAAPVSPWWALGGPGSGAPSRNRTRRPARGLGLSRSGPRASSPRREPGGPRPSRHRAPRARAPRRQSPRSDVEEG
jgi:hypothetical protein